MRRDFSYFTYNKANFEVIYIPAQCSLVYISSSSYVCCIRRSDVRGELKYLVAKKGKTTEIVKSVFQFLSRKFRYFMLLL